MERIRKSTPLSITCSFLLILVAAVIISSGCASQFKTVTATLNTPELIDKYERENFSYATTRDGYGCGGVDISESTAGCSSSYIFYSKRGNCAAFTTFAVYCLREAGYEAYPVKVYEKWPSWFLPSAPARDFHYVTLYKDDNKWYIMDNGRGKRPRGIIGPFKSIEDIHYKITNIEGKSGK